MTRRLLIIGNGMVADRLLDELAARDRLTGDHGFAITLVGEENGQAYNRILLSQVLAGNDPDTITHRAPGWAASVDIRHIAGRWVQRLDTVRQVAHIGNGEEIPYDIAVLATGSRPIIPPISGARTPEGGTAPGVHVYRTLADCLALRDAATAAEEIVIVGGGLLGLEAAAVLAETVPSVTVVHPTPTLLDVQLDAVAGSMLHEALLARGITVAVGRAQDALHEPDGTLRALKLDDGRILGADAVVLTTGVRPRIECATASGLRVERGIIVDDNLATSAPNVYAIGDCAEHRNVCNGLVSAGYEQAAVLAARLSGDTEATYGGAPRATRLKVAGIEIAAMGVRDPEPDDDILTIHQPRQHIYRRLLIRNGRVAGAIIYGDPDGAANIIGVYDRQSQLPDHPLDLFCTTDAFTAPNGRVDTICTCNQVDEAAIVTAIENGAHTVPAIGEATRAGTGCGTCKTRLAQLLEGLRIGTAPAPLS